MTQKICIKCNSINTSRVGAMCDDCLFKEESLYNKALETLKGWRCMECESVYAPWYPRCDSCRP